MAKYKVTHEKNVLMANGRMLPPGAVFDPDEYGCDKAWLAWRERLTMIEPVSAMRGRPKKTKEVGRAPATKG